MVGAVVGRMRLVLMGGKVGHGGLGESAQHLELQSKNPSEAREESASTALRRLDQFKPSWF